MKFNSKLTKSEIMLIIETRTSEKRNLTSEDIYRLPFRRNQFRLLVYNLPYFVSPDMELLYEMRIIPHPRTVFKGKISEKMHNTIIKGYFFIFPDPFPAFMLFFAIRYFLKYTSKNDSFITRLISLFIQPYFWAVIFIPFIFGLIYRLFFSQGRLNKSGQRRIIEFIIQNLLE